MVGPKGSLSIRLPTYEGEKGLWLGPLGLLRLFKDREGEAMRDSIF